MALKIRPGWWALSALALCGAAIADTDHFPDLDIHGMLDLRYQHPEGPVSWVAGGLGKLSYDQGQSGGNIFSLNQAALLMQSRFNWSWSGSLTAKYSDRQNTPLDISEGFLLYKPVSTSAWRFSGRLGAFMPPVSLENTGVGWSSPYTLSNSAINSWVGEELKVFGGEAQLGYQLSGGERITVFGAGFGNNDTAGVLLAWRGWSLDNYTATLNDSYAIPTQTGLLALFPRQSAYTRPFVEVDDRPGFYSGFSLESPGFAKFRAMYYDNRGNPGVVRNGQYAWHTRFGDFGLKMDLPWEIELIGQGMLGRTQMGGEIAGLFAVDTLFWSESLLLSRKFGSQRLSARYDNFGASEHDYLPQDPNNESGYAFTCNYNITLFGQHQLNLEMSAIYSNRASRLKIPQAALQNETLWQMAYRWFF
ncbi:MAG: hypothetical protein PHW13_12780 [Methylococcales bacterium]|nr:hypothetical protein [Methylococcales bacterium]